MIIAAWTPAVVFYVLQNNYFGWNSTPRSDAEVIADGILLVLVSLAVIATVLSTHLKAQNDL